MCVCFLKWHILVLFKETKMLFNELAIHVRIFKQVGKITCKEILACTTQNRSKTVKDIQVDVTAY